MGSSLAGKVVWLLAIAIVQNDVTVAHPHMAKSDSHPRANCCVEPPGPMIDDVRIALAEGEHAYSQGRYIDAMKHLRRGLTTLGSCYQMDGVIDDSGMRIAKAAGDEQRGNVREAAASLKYALLTRVSLYDKMKTGQRQGMSARNCIRAAP